MLYSRVSRAIRSSNLCDAPAFPQSPREIACHLTYLTRIADLLSIPIGMIADPLFLSLIFGGRVVREARLHFSSYFVYVHDPNQSFLGSSELDLGEIAW